METSYNLRSPAVKRLMKEAREMKDASVDYSAKPLEDNLFEWHFTFRGPDDSDFHDGVYHGRIILPPEYPMKPPSILLLTPNGRFELHKKICLSISGYHPESWQPSWSIRTAILAIIGFMPTKGEGAIGALDYTPEERKKLARQSQSFSCPTCGLIKDLLASEATDNDNDKKDKELAKQIMFAKPKLTKETPQSSSQEDPVQKEEGEESTSVQTVRHRTQAPVPHDVTTSNPTVQTPERSTNRQTDTTSFYLMVILAVAIALLFFRRLDRVFDLTSYLNRAM